MAYSSGNWYGDKYYFGLHYDLHAGKTDTNIGTHCSPEQLIPMLQLMKPDFVETDCKGHPGMTSWFSQVPDATVSPGVQKDAMIQWRQATRQLGLPLHCHYSGIFDVAAAEKHPEWAVQPAPGSDTKSDKMCPRSPYVDKLLIPQFLELIDRYDVDGFWVDGEIWGVEPCYCDKCKAEFTRRTGITVPPVNLEDPNWTKWMQFQLDSYKEYLIRYVNAVHQHKPGVKVCSNWFQTYRCPGNSEIETDWVSGDNSPAWGMDGSRLEARYISNRGKPWDIMLWSFSKTHDMGDNASPWCLKPAEMLEQEASMILSTGGNVQIYETTSLRNGQLVPWHMKRLGEVGEFVHARRNVCQNTKSFPQIAVLHSEVHFYSKSYAANLWDAGFRHAEVDGAVWCLSDCHRGVDILDENMMKTRANEFPVIVVPGQVRMSPEMVTVLKNYAEQGGILILSNPESANVFGYDFAGIKDMTKEEDRVYYLPVHGNRAVPLFSHFWGKVVPNDNAKVLCTVLKTQLTDDIISDYPAAVLMEHGKGKVVFLPTEIFSDYSYNRYPDTAHFLNDILDAVWENPQIKVTAGAAFDFIARTSEKNGILLHFINRSSGLPTTPRQAMIDEIPPTGPVKVSIRLAQKPESVKNVFPLTAEDGSVISTCTWKWEDVSFTDENGNSYAGILTAVIPLVKIHDVIQIQ